jgi:TRAP transporter 4TM/12TM fusion protein
MDEEGTRVRKLRGIWRMLIIAASIVTVLVCVNQQFTLRFFVGYTLLDTEYIYLLIVVLFPFTFLLYPSSKRASANTISPLDIALFIAAMGSSAWLMFHVRQSASLGWDFIGGPNSVLVAGGILWALLLEALRRIGGWSMFWCILPFSMYPLFASWEWLGPFQGVQSSLPQAISYHMLSAESVLGVTIRAFVDVVIGFLVFGTALTMTGAGAFFVNLAFAACGTFRGGAAKVAIFASGLLGMMSGSIVSNVITSGAVTIPLMKRGGFSAARAGAIESCAATGAVIAPPVMGATAFVIAEFLDVSYAEVAMAAAIPALLYYLGLFMQVDAYAARLGLRGIPRSELPKLRDTLKGGWYYLLVVGLLLVIMLYLKRESHAPFFATILLIALNQIFNRRGRWDWKRVLAFFEELGRVFTELVAILAGCGLLVGAFVMTGVVASIANDLLKLADGNALSLLVMCAVTSMILGLGLTTTACYIFLALLIAPALEKLGLNAMAVHMFIFYWGMLSAITPPVAIASFAAAGVANASPMKTGLYSMTMGSIIYFIPFFFVFDPSLLLQGEAPYGAAAASLAFIVLGVFFLCGGLQGYVARLGDLRRAGSLEWPARVFFMCGGILIATPGSEVLGFTKVTLLALGGCFIVAGFVVTLIGGLWNVPQNSAEAERVST